MNTVKTNQESLITPYRKGDLIGYKFDPKTFTPPCDEYVQGDIYLYNKKHHSWLESVPNRKITLIRISTTGGESDSQKLVLCACIRLYKKLFGIKNTVIEANVNHLNLHLYSNNLLVNIEDIAPMSDFKPYFTVTTEEDFAAGTKFDGMVTTVPNTSGDISTLVEYSNLKIPNNEIVAHIMGAIFDGFNESPLTLNYNLISERKLKAPYIYRTYKIIEKCVSKIGNVNGYNQDFIGKDIQILGLSSFVDYYLITLQGSLNPSEGFQFAFNLTKELNSYFGTEKVFGGRKAFNASLVLAFTNLKFFLENIGIV